MPVEEEYRSGDGGRGRKAMVNFPHCCQMQGITNSKVMPSSSQRLHSFCPPPVTPRMVEKSGTTSMRSPSMQTDPR